MKSPVETEKILLIELISAKIPCFAGHYPHLCGFKQKPKSKTESMNWDKLDQELTEIVEKADSTRWNGLQRRELR